jgi:hypothetical protein
MFTPWDINQPPDFVNELGIKWWFDAETTKWAHRKDSKGISLPDIHCFFIEKPDGYKSRVLIQNNKDIYESQSLEAVACRIDILKCIKQEEV